MLLLTSLLTLLVAEPAGLDLRTKLTVGELSIPSGLDPQEGPIDLLVHLHGSAPLMEQNLKLADKRAVLVTTSLNGLSSVYTRQFAEPQTFMRLVDEASKKTSDHFGGQPIAFRRIILSSFSAGFGGVRELLKSEECFRRIDVLVMADSIYAGYVEDSRKLGVDPDLMGGFLRFAREAATGKKQMLISHCQLKPDGYASTAETADYLIQTLQLHRRPVTEPWRDDWFCESRCEQSGLKIFGFRGTEGSDHMQHLRNIGRLWQLVTD